MDKAVEIKDDLIRPRKNMFDLVGKVRLRDDYDYKGLRAADAVIPCGDHPSATQEARISSAQRLSLMKIDRERVTRLIDELFRITDELTAMTGRAFTPDGHLVGSIGEVLAASAYGLDLEPHSTKGCDATTGGRRIEIKATFGDRVAFREHGESHELDHCLVLKLQRTAAFEEIYNGPAKPIINRLSVRPLPSNGQRQISLAQLRVLNSQVSEGDRLPRVCGVRHA